MSELYVTWEQYHQDIEKLAANIYQSGWEFDQIVCLARGGLRVGDILCRLYHKPLGILFTSSYDDNQSQREFRIAQHLTMIQPTLKGRILMVDDIADSGITLEETLNWLTSHYSDTIEDIRIGVIWHKERSIVKPDYCARYFPDNPWIHQPFSVYEHMTPADLVNRYQV